MENTRIARLVREGFLKQPLFQGFSDIRRHPVIRLQAILLSLFAMPFCGMRSLLSNDREARTEGYKRLFGCQRKMVASDSTLARVLKWLDPQQSRMFLLSFLTRFEQRDLLRKRLSPEGRPWRLGILDGSYMGGHWLATLCLVGRINYPVMIQRYEGRGDEQMAARELMKRATTQLGKQCPELWLLDALYFNTNTIRIARAQHSHVLFKFKDAELRVVTQDAQNLFQHFGGDKERSGWDKARQCHWTVRQTVDRFSGYPVQVVELTESYPKRKRDRKLTCWIVTTAMDLSLEELREAAHQRWQIENNVFKRISHLSGTKRFYFKDPRQFFNLLHLFFAAVAVLDYIVALLNAHPQLFAALRAGIKGTWRNLFSRLRDVLNELPCAFEYLT